MNLFGCKFCRKSSDQTTSCDRKNFDSLLWAIVTVFQVRGSRKPDESPYRRRQLFFFLQCTH